ncbi:MAG: type IV toxin-antitoxin system AbiEi family antitoxin domain-containing protein, partial [Candidatus Dojkabacteria bacterium]
DQKVLIQLEKGKYQIAGRSPSDFAIAQFLYSPSYISFETALNYHGILPQFPHEITSATMRRKKTI